ncbi:hypothetical protein DSECCO2_526580 [anaerobic digester metagenome]
MIGSMSLKYGMAGVERNAGPPDLCRMYTVAAKLRGCFDHSLDLRSCLQQLIGDDDSDIPRPDHQDFPTRENPVDVDHGLCSSGPHDSGECPAWKIDDILVGPGCQYDAFGMDGQGCAFITHHPDFILIEYSAGFGIEPDFDIQFFRLLQQQGSDINPTYTCAMFPRTEKFVDLLEQLAAGLCVFINQQHLRSSLGSFDCRTQSSRAGSDNNYISFHHMLSFPSPIAESHLRLYHHSLFDRCNTGADIGRSVDRHHTIGTATDAAEDTARFMSFHRLSKIGFAGCHQCCSNHFPFPRFNRFAVNIDGDFLLLWKRTKYRMIKNPLHH